MKRDEHDRCWYCEMPLAPRHEHDHVPPQRHGGKQTVPACMNCHEMKDRIPLADWTPDQVMTALASVPPGPGRLLLGKLHALGLDIEAATAVQTLTRAVEEELASRNAARGAL